LKPEVRATRLARMSSDAKRISRRSTLAAASGFLMIGSGLGAVLVAPGARAADGTKFFLKLHKHAAGKKKKLIATIELPEALLEQLAAAGDEPLTLVVERGNDNQSKLLGKGELADGDKLKHAVKNARNKKQKKKK
jgi:hypothetical protein